MIYPLQIPIIINPFKKHNEIKHTLLDMINNHRCSNYTFSGDESYLMHISKCDWPEGKIMKPRPWTNFFLPLLNVHLIQSMHEFNQHQFDITQLWFQQYNTNSNHSWHTHGNNWTNVYYLDLPPDSPKTQFINPIDNSIQEFNVSEGDILSFPSFIPHQAPTNLSNSTKTIISWNMDTTINPRKLPQYLDK